MHAAEQGHPQALLVHPSLRTPKHAHLYPQACPAQPRRKSPPSPFAAGAQLHSTELAPGPVSSAKDLLHRLSSPSNAIQSQQTQVSVPPVHSQVAHSPILGYSQVPGSYSQVPVLHAQDPFLQQAASWAELPATLEAQLKGQATASFQFSGQNPASFQCSHQYPSAAAATAPIHSVPGMARYRSPINAHQSMHTDMTLASHCLNGDNFSECCMSQYRLQHA